MVSDKTLAVITGIGAITIIESVALLKGIDGTLLMASLSALGVLVGYVFGFTIHKDRKE